MTDFSHRMIEEVTRAAQRIHGLYSTCSAYRTALVAELRAADIPVHEAVVFPESYEDVEVLHCLDIIAGSEIGIEIRSIQNVLPNQYSSSLLEFYLRKAGLSYGLVVDFAGQELGILPVSLSLGYGGTG